LAGLSRIGSLRTQTQDRLAELERAIARRTPLEAELAALDTTAATIPDLEAQAAAAEAARSEAADALATARAHLAEIQARFLHLQRGVEENEAARQALEPTGSLVHQLGHAERELPGLEAEIAQLDEEIRGLAGRLAQEPEVADWLAGAEQAMARIGAALARGREELSGLRAAEQHALQEAAERRAELARLESLAAEQTAARTAAAGLRARHGVLLTLAEFYKQAPLLIMEHEAIPALEEDANRILARISVHGMRVRFETQRALKTRDGLVDGLEIVVTDQAGERSLACYSGGQRFQVHLAIRIALAKLQARRAGAGIETFCVDEGFGSQSAEALAGVLQALRAVQDEFPLLLVISHVEAMRDVFPTRIEVTGGPLGSTARLSP
jgi:exonuclease SbcC